MILRRRWECGVPVRHWVGGGRIPSHGFKDGSKGFGDKDRVWDRGHTTTTLNLLRCVVITDIVAGQGRGHFASKDMAELWEQD
jgi:hypothetical protein